MVNETLHKCSIYTNDEIRATTNPRVTLNTTRSNISGSLVSLSPKFHSISLYKQLLSSYGPLFDKCTDWAQNDIEHYKVKIRFSIYKCHCIPNCNPLCSTASHYRDTFYYFETDVPKWCTDWLWTPIGHIKFLIFSTTCSIPTQVNPTFLPLHSTIFELQVILRQVHWMNPKRPWKL